MNAGPLVSIVIPVYNGEKHLEEALRSVFEQTYANTELIVIDDGSSSDECRKICQKYAARLKYTYQTNTGLSGARNAGLKRCRGEYIAFIDQDDIWLPDKLAKQVALFEELRNKGVPVGLVYTRLSEIDLDGRETGRSRYSLSGRLLRELITGNRVGTPSSVLTRREVLERVGAFDERIVAYSDWDLFIRIAYAYEIHCIDECLTRYRRSHGSLSDYLPEIERDLRYLWHKVVKRYPEMLAEIGLTPRAYQDLITGEMAAAWKAEAFRRLILHGDGRAFRHHVRHAFRAFPSSIAPGVWVYYLISHISVPLCLYVIRRRRKESPRP